MRTALPTAAALLCACATALAADPPADARLGKPRTLDDQHNLTVPADRAAWEARAAEVRRQVRIAAGLWPMPEKTPLHAVVHSPIDRGDYVVEKVYFQSLPGFYVTGNLYRPKGRTGRLPAVLCPHGHWPNGRFYWNSDKGVEAEIKAGRETDPLAARSPLQARCVQLARMGAVVFHYDMVGYADGFQIEHRKPSNTPNELGGPAAEAWGVSTFGLQTWNSIRALDFLLSRPDVDPARIACTGSSGGGTQTFILAAVDDRPAASVPVVMVSTGMQGGCQCENGPYLRVGTDNIELAALFAPKPQLVIAATGDWTKELLEKGAPELKAVYNLFDAGGRFEAVRYTAPHNYNKASRTAMYGFLGKHLLGVADPAAWQEKPFTPIEPKDLSVWDEKHPKPADALTPEKLREAMIARAKAAIEAVAPSDAAGSARFREVVGGGLRTICNTDVPRASDIEGRELQSLAGTVSTPAGPVTGRVDVLTLSRRGAGERVGLEIVTPDTTDGTAVLVVGDSGRAGVPTELWGLANRGRIVAAADVFLTADKAPEPTGPFFAGYNRTAFGNRVHDILTAAAFLKSRPGVRTVHVVGLGRAGAWVLAAKGIAGELFARTAADGSGLAAGLAGVPSGEAVGGMRMITALAAPGELLVFGKPAGFATDVLERVYRLAGGPRPTLTDERLPASKVADWLAR
jgi:dienelactone hydrolase